MDSTGDFPFEGMVCIKKNCAQLGKSSPQSGKGNYQKPLKMKIKEVFFWELIFMTNPFTIVSKQEKPLKIKGFFGKNISLDFF